MLHLAVRPDRWSDEVLALNLLVEGLAVATAHEVDPGLAPAGLFSVVDWEGWRRACLSAWAHAVAELLERFDQVDRLQYRRFFWPDWIRTHTDVPERIGYFIGYEVARALAQRHALSEIVRWPAQRANVEVYSLLKAWPHAPDGHP